METTAIQTGLDQTYKIDITNKLNLLLADYQAYYMNLRGLHWNVKGNHFFMLHEKYEELYTDASEVVDEIAERILSLGLTPLHTFEDYIENKTIMTVKDVSDGKTGLHFIVENLNILLDHERSILAISGEHNDEGTASLMSDLIGKQEKLIWMLTSVLE